MPGTPLRSPSGPAPLNAGASLLHIDPCLRLLRSGHDPPVRSCLHRSSDTPDAAAFANRGGCRIKLSEKTRSALAEVHARADVRVRPHDGPAARDGRDRRLEPTPKTIQRRRRGCIDSLRKRTTVLSLSRGQASRRCGRGIAAPPDATPLPTRDVCERFVTSRAGSSHS